MLVPVNKDYMNTTLYATENASSAKFSHAIDSIGQFLRHRTSRQYILSKMFSFTNALLLLVCSVFFFLSSIGTISAGIAAFPVSKFYFFLENLFYYFFGQTLIDEIIDFACLGVSLFATSFLLILSSDTENEIFSRENAPSFKNNDYQSQDPGIYFHTINKRFLVFSQFRN